ncbi:MAG: hypothetical protein QNL80_00785 [Akkermansiaceae bacterium]
MSNHHRQPAGRIMVSFPIFSLVALLLGVATEFMGIFDPANEWLRGGWESGGIDFSTTAGLTGPTGFLIGLVSVFALVAAILGTPGDLRRIIIGLSGLILSLALIPVFAVWGIFWKPFGMTLGILWAWFSSFLYARTHRMPCDVVNRGEIENVTQIKKDLLEQTRSRRSDG